MENKFSMSVEQNVFCAKRMLVDSIWKSANLEGISVTFPDTEAVCNGLSVPGMKVDDIIAINNLKRAWQFVLDTLDVPTNYPFICEVNRRVGGDNLIWNAGFIRNVPVSVGGTVWKPEMPIESQIKEELSEITEIESTTDRSLSIMLYCMRKQMFLDGNKRTAMLAANHELIMNGAGIVSIPLEKQRDFTKLLIEFYESGDMSQIKPFVYDCIDGIDFHEG